MHRLHRMSGSSIARELAALVRLHDAGMKSMKEGDVSALLEELLDDVIAATHADCGSVQLSDPRTRELRVVAERGLPDAPVASRSTPLVSRSGEPLGVIATHFRRPHRPGPSELKRVDRLVRHSADFIECARLRQSMEEACARETASRERAEAANLSKDHFLAMLAHELRQPLSAVFPAIELQRRGHGLENHAAEVMERQLRHLARLVEDLSDASRISRGEIDLARERIDVRAAIQQALDMTAPLFHRRNQQTAIELGPHPVWVDGDRTRLTQVFSNLLRNACSYTQEHGCIRAALETRGGQAAFTLRDNGLGIPPDALGRIFELFDRGSHPHDSPGVGIGLAVVKQLVELHGGTVCATSAGAGHGSEFVVLLPIADGPSGNGPAGMAGV